MSTKTEIVVCRGSYRKGFSAIFRQGSFSTATCDCTRQRNRSAGDGIEGSRCGSRGRGHHHQSDVYCFGKLRGCGGGAPGHGGRGPRQPEPDRGYDPADDHAADEGDRGRPSCRLAL